MVWNRPFAEVLALPSETLHIGAGFDRILRALALRGEFGPGDIDKLVSERAGRLLSAEEPQIERLAMLGLFIEVRAARLPDGGIVTTYTDVTASVAAAEELERANETLERRVRERTEELTRLNAELAQAKQEADEANLSKTRFLAAASHDILQPLNAARLYTTSLVERRAEGDDRRLVDNVDASLEAVEEILGALLDISRLDAGAMKPEIASFRIDELFRQLAVEFAPLAQQKGLKLSFVPTSLAVHSDRRLLRRLLQNLVSNAIKYTSSAAFWSAVGAAARSCRWRCTIPAPAFPRQAADHLPGVPAARAGCEDRPRPRARPVDRRAYRPRAGAPAHREVEGRSGFILRRRRADRPGPAGSRARTSTAPIAAAPLDGLTVLAIDNEPKILEGMQVLLTGWGCHTLVAAGWHEAHDILNERQVAPDVVIVDYHLDEGNGFGRGDAVALALRPRPARHPHHGGSQPGGPRDGPGAERPSSEQAGEAGGAPRPPRPVAGPQAGRRIGRVSRRRPQP